MRIGTALLIAGACFLCFRPCEGQEIWVGKDGNIRNIDTRAIIIEQDGLYLATKYEVFRAKGVGDKWESVFALPSGENEIRCLGCGARNVFVGTSKGLFRSEDRGKSWRNVFRTIMPGKNNIISIDISKYDPKRIMIGTEKGVFLSHDAGAGWQDMSEGLRNKSIGYVAMNKDSVYAGGDDGLYIKRDSSSGWERIYVQSSDESSGNEEGGEVSTENEEEAEATVICVAIKGSRIYAGLNRKILYSDDDGKTWRNFPSDGLAGGIKYILASKKSERLYCATTKGIFEYMPERSGWNELYRGLDRMVSVTSLVFCQEDEKSLWAVTDKGLYRMESGFYAQDQYVDVERNLKKLQITFNGEPNLSQLQQAAMKFNEVSPDKIKNWRTQARLKALVPKINVGTYKRASTNTEIYTSATRDYVAVGPDDISNGLDVSASWDLGSLIWSDDQTSIDVRSRLTTQLRNDILDDLRRVYFERKRLQFELIQSPPKDIRIRFEKEMRLQELTQAIDDLTGNYLSENIKGYADASQSAS